MNKRGSGILLHITSLSSPYGVGDLGPEACRFANFLARAKQRYWQVFPLNPTDPVYGNSPFNSVSAFAGDIGGTNTRLAIIAIVQGLKDPDSKISRLARQWPWLSLTRRGERTFHPHGDQKVLMLSRSSP